MKNRSSSPNLETQFMASHKAETLSLITYLIVISFSLSASSRILPSEELSLRLPPSNSEKVSLGIYCEALCPFCSYFYAYLLPDLVYDEELLSIVDLSIYPWGQTSIMSNGTWDCIHGPDECVLNTLEACAIHVWPKLEDYFPFFRCVSASTYDSAVQRRPNQWRTCLHNSTLNTKPLLECASNGTGVQLELEYADITFALEPPVFSVPWIVVNGQPIKNNYLYYIDDICDAYKGPNVPKACSKRSGNRNEVNAPVCSATSTLLEGRAVSM